MVLSNCFDELGSLKTLFDELLLWLILEPVSNTCNKSIVTHQSASSVQVGKETVRFNNPRVLQPALTYSASSRCACIAVSIYPTGRESSRCGDVRQVLYEK